MTAPVDARYTLRAIEQMLGVSRAVVGALIAEGFVTPARGLRNEYRFSFQDVVLLRTAHALRAARIAPSRILRSLKRLRATLPAELPLSGLRISAVGADIAVRDGHHQWAADSGQMLLDFEVASVGGQVAFLVGPATPASTARIVGGGVAGELPDSAAEAAQWFARGEALEATDPGAAEAAYRSALALQPGHADAGLNLGALLCDQGRTEQALALCDEAIAAGAPQALLHFNRAIALEDLGRLDEALAAYGRCLQLDAGVADAHFNAARLHEQLGHAQLALRHFSAYRRLLR